VRVTNFLILIIIIKPVSKPMPVCGADVCDGQSSVQVDAATNVLVATFIGRQREEVINAASN